MGAPLCACAVVLLVALPALAQVVPAPAQPARQQQEPEAQRPRIEARAEPGQDEEIARRLEQIFSHLEGAGDVRVEVRSGVVTLSGEVPSPAVRERVVEIAGLVEGVVEVGDETELVRDLSRQLTPAWQRLRELSSDAIGSLPLLLFTLVVVLLFWVAGVLLSRWSALFRRVTRNEFLADFLRQLTKLAALAIGLVVAFQVLDATALAGSVLGAAGLLGLALGFALRDTVENYVAGILLSTRQPFVHDDWVVIEGHEGRVLRLTTRATLLMTLDGNHVRIPNARVFNGVVVNYTRNPERRFHVDVDIGLQADLAGAQDLVVRTLADLEGVLSEPPPHAEVLALGDFSARLRAYGWVDQRHYGFLEVRSEAARLLKDAFDAAGVPGPEPTRLVRLQEAGPPPPRPGEGRPRTGARPRAADVRPRAEVEPRMADERRAREDGDLLRPGAPLE